MIQNDTICALATAIGGALGVVRVSGPDAFAAVSAISKLECGDCHANTIHFTHIITTEGETIDEVLVSIFKAPHSYTGEDSVEISCHGSRYILNKVIELLVQNGCRMANPGEYTMRAYLNGKMDLSQAEAVADLIASSNKATHQIAMSQLRGGISNELEQLREQLLKMTSLVELELDFSDHEDLEFADRSELLALAQTIEAHILRLAKSFETGQALKEGIPVAIIGKTNVGKSTLLNRLLKDERAIVSDIHGTTRDTIEDVMEINGVQFRFIDTAGIRQTNDKVEQIGIERTYQAIAKARIVLWLFDEAPSADEIKDICKRTEGKALLPVRNKSDLYTTPNVKYTAELTQSPPPPSVMYAAPPTQPPTLPSVKYAAELPQPHLQISAKTGQGIAALQTAIFNAANLPTLSETDIIITNARHYDTLIRANHNLHRVISAISLGISGDLLSEDLRLVLSDLSEITGKGQITPHEVLGNIFKHFCVGK